VYLFWLMLAYPDTSSAACPWFAMRNAHGRQTCYGLDAPRRIRYTQSDSWYYQMLIADHPYLCMFHARGRLWTSDRPTRSNQAVMRNPSLFINAQYPKLLFNACMSCVKKSGGYRAKEGYRRRKSEMQRCIGASDPVTSFGVRSARGTRCPGVSTCRASRQSRRSLSQPGS